VKLRLHRVLCCLLLAAAVGKSQAPAAAQTPAAAPEPAQAPAPAQTPAPAPVPIPISPPAAPPSPQTPTAPQPTPNLRPPVEVASPVNNGHGLSLDVVDLFGRSRPVLRGGDADPNTEPGNFNYDTNPSAAIYYRLSIPIGSNGVVRTSYFQTQSTGITTAPANEILFGQPILGGDTVATRYRFEDIKMSYEYLTYFWKRKNSEIRLKTLYELQRMSVSNEVDDFVLNNNQTAYTVNTATGSRAIFSPTFGLGIEYTLSPHFRLEARGSGFGYIHHGDIGDVDATVAYRRGRFEAIGGYRLLHFKTSPKNEQYDVGTIYGPYVGLRVYWEKR
jgi:hypothetical protein